MQVSGLHIRLLEYNFVDETLIAGDGLEQDSESRSAVEDIADSSQLDIHRENAAEDHDDQVTETPLANSKSASPYNPEPNPIQPAESPSYTLRGSVSSHFSPIERSSPREPHPSIRVQAILLRYYTEEIAHRFDLCDPEYHFTNAVPQRARSCRPLLNAILTTSARHLCGLARYRNRDGTIEWQGHALLELSQESPVYYHNECIRDLLELSLDPDQVHNENLLAAAVILRTDEEMNGPLTYGDEDSEVFLRMLNIFIDAQIPSTQVPMQDSPLVPSPHLNFQPEFHSPAISQPTPSESQPLPFSPSNTIQPEGDAITLRRAVFAVALRQELFTSFMKQRSLHFQLSHYENFRDLSPAQDAVWAHRAVVFCADVFEYCYGSRSGSEVYHYHHSGIERWHRLQRYEQQFSMALPPSFEPMHSRPADHTRGEVFPEIWHLNTYHRTGMAHLELARILLAVFDPTRPRLGPGAMTSHRELGKRLRQIVLRLCGIAMCNRKSPPAFIEALMGISTCGEYFELRREQEALLEVLRIIQEEQAYSTLKVKHALERAWSLASTV
ncbi:uncharacterized protein N7458_009632 [Penicillium daleae]|uniref:ARCA protein n=1 Tax=Penicillium daleae TaxID=63821 RepID=A0AAD6BXB3_9EURO|nr:uncharacterized protein N7458_009632 [Penicillium daleae]KAJ5438634.1 hypothetical protein N7458_009632 [Penicillium daleae]